MAIVNLRKEAKRKEFYVVDPKIITIEDGFNVRLDTQELLQHVAWLKTSIREEGVLNPITVRKVGDEYVITDGHQRHRAVTELAAEGLEIKIPIILEDTKLRSDVDRIAGLFLHNSQYPLTIPEQSDVVKRLLKYGLSEKEVAKKIAKSVGHIQHLLKYMELPPEVKEMVVEGKVSPSAAIKESFESGEKVTEVLKDAEEIAGGAKVTKKHIDAAKDKKSTTPVKKIVTINKPVTASEPVSVGLFNKVYKYAESLIGTNDELANWLIDTCEELDNQIKEYEDSLVTTEED